MKSASNFAIKYGLWFSLISFQSGSLWKTTNSPTYWLKTYRNSPTQRKIFSKQSAGLLIKAQFLIILILLSKFQEIRSLDFCPGFMPLSSLLSKSSKNCWRRCLAQIYHQNAKTSELRITQPCLISKIRWRCGMNGFLTMMILNPTTNSPSLCLDSHSGLKVNSLSHLCRNSLTNYSKYSKKRIDEWLTLSSTRQTHWSIARIRK